MRTYSELTLEERVEIQQLLESGDSLRAIGRALGRAPSTISRECRRIGSKASHYQGADGASTQSAMPGQSD